MTPGPILVAVGEGGDPNNDIDMTAFSRDLEVPFYPPAGIEGLAALIMSHDFGPLIRLGYAWIRYVPDREGWLITLTTMGQEAFEAWRKKRVQ